MNINEVIKYPILSEKSYQQMSAGVYTFAVDFRTNKAEVKKVVEHIFDVKVGKVNIMNIKKKITRVGESFGSSNRYKKAIVTLTEGTINIFPDEAEAPVEETKAKDAKAKEAKAPKEMSEAEKKAAAKIAAKAETKANDKAEVKTEAKPATKAEETK